MTADSDRETVWVDVSALVEAPSRLVDVAAWAELLLSKIPPDMRDKTTVEIGEISYERLETDEEYMARLAKEREHAAECEANERKRWEWLQERYPNGAPPAGEPPTKGLEEQLEWLNRVEYAHLLAKYGALPAPPLPVPHRSGSA